MPRIIISTTMRATPIGQQDKRNRIRLSIFERRYVVREVMLYIENEMRANRIVLWIFLGIGVALSADTSFEEGERLLRENKPIDAQGYLEDALNGDPGNEKTYLYLGIVYEQLQRPQKAISIMQRGLEIASVYKDLLLFNIGNNFFQENELRMATEMYSRALAVNSSLSGAYLNRANARVKLAFFEEAVSDYVRYLNLEPVSQQRSSVEQMVKILSAKVAEDKQRRAEEAERQQALMNAVMSSLQNASENTKNLSAGSAQIEEKYEELDIAE